MSARPRTLYGHLAPQRAFSYLLYLCESYNYVGFGSAGEYWEVGTTAWHARIREAFAAVQKWETESNGAYIRPRLHMMRAQSMAHLYPFDSSDSTNVARNHHRYRNQNQGRVARLATRTSAKIRAGSGPEAEHELKRPLLDHAEHQAWYQRINGYYWTNYLNTPGIKSLRSTLTSREA